MAGGLALIGACGLRNEAAPRAGDVRGALPDLRGSRVLVLPVQFADPGTDEADAEIRFALGARGGTGTADWIFEEEIQRSLARSPGLDVRMDALEVGAFLRAEVRRVGDPLFGTLRRLSALMRARLVLVPVEVRETEVVEGGTSQGVAAELVVALIDARDGRVRWFAVLRGDPVDAGGAGAVASVADRLARTLVP